MPLLPLKCNGYMAERNIPPPGDFENEARTLWRSTQRRLRRQGTWQDGDCELLERYVRAVVLYRTARTAAEGSPWTKGSKGQLVAHPAVKVAREAAHDAHTFASELLLTPKSRARAGVKTGERTDALEALLTAD